MSLNVKCKKNSHNLFLFKKHYMSSFHNWTLNMIIRSRNENNCSQSCLQQIWWRFIWVCSLSCVQVIWFQLLLVKYVRCQFVLIALFVGHEDSIKIVEIIPVHFPQDQAENPNFHGEMLHFHRAARSAEYLQDNLYKRILKRDNVPNNIYKYLRVNWIWIKKLGEKRLFVLKVSGTPASYLVHVRGHWRRRHFVSINISTCHVSTTSSFLFLANARICSIILLRKKLCLISVCVEIFAPLSIPRL